MKNPLHKKKKPPEQRLALLAARRYLPHADDGTLAELSLTLRDILGALQPQERQEIIRLLSRARVEPVLRAPPRLLEWLLDRVGNLGLIRWLVERLHLSDAPRQTEVLVRARMLPEADRLRLFEAGVRFLARMPTSDDQALIVTKFEPLTKEMTMTSFGYDSRGLPTGFITDNWAKAVNVRLKDYGIADPANDADFTSAAIRGMLLTDEQFQTDTPDFEAAFERVWREAHAKTVQLVAGTPASVGMAVLYEAVAEVMLALRGNDASKITLQEFATVSRYVAAHVDDVPVGHQYFSTQVQIAINQYVSGPPAFESLTLPPLSTTAADNEVEPENIRAVALVYAAFQLERLRLFHVVDRLTERFLHGQLPVGFDNSGKALDTYYWNSEDRMNESARRAVFSRVLGAPGGDVPKDVLPNKDFEQYFLRFLSSIAEYDRQRQVGTLLDNSNNRPRAVTLTSEQVRKSGNDFSSNTSLYGWGYTHFAARRLNADIIEALNILKLPQIQRAYGATNPWQVIERVSANEFGTTPNIVRYRTMAESGKAILDLVAKYALVWSSTSGNPLFTDPNLVLITNAIPADINLQDTQTLLNHTQYWLAVNGVGDDQIGKLSQPVESKVAPSLPPLGGGSIDGGAIDKLKQLVSGGTAPSIDQLKALLPSLPA